jgi:hypothetical protein
VRDWSDAAGAPQGGGYDYELVVNRLTAGQGRVIVEPPASAGSSAPLAAGVLGAELLALGEFQTTDDGDVLTFQIPDGPIVQVRIVIGLDTPVVGNGSTAALGRVSVTDAQGKTILASLVPAASIIF